MVCYLFLDPAELRRMCFPFRVSDVCSESDLGCLYWAYVCHYSLGNVKFGAVMYALAAGDLNHGLGTKGALVRVPLCLGSIIYFVLCCIAVPQQLSLNCAIALCLCRSPVGEVASRQCSLVVHSIQHCV